MGVNLSSRLGYACSMRNTLFLVLFLPFFTIISVAEDYCDREDFTARCNESQVILMEVAEIGRMRSQSRCIPGQAYIGCRTSILDYMDQQCSGRRECSMDVGDLEKLNTACSPDYKLYLEADYSCIDVYDPIPCNQSRIQRLSSDDGFLSSVTFWEKKIGTGKCPWSVTVKPGQRIEVIYYDFTVDVTLSLTTPSDCPVKFVAVEEDGGRTEKELCSIVGQNKQSEKIHTSKSNSLTFHLNMNESIFPQESYFLLKHQIVGCADIEAPEGGYVVRDDDSATVRCNATGETWYLVCKDVEWLGDLANCSKGEKYTTESDDDNEMTEPEQPGGDSGGFPWGIVIAVVIGVAIGCVVGGGMLCILFLCRRCIKKRREKKERAHNNDLSRIEIPTVGKQMEGQPIYPTREGVYSTGPRLVRGTVPGMANEIAHAHGQPVPGTSYARPGEQPGYGGWGPGGGGGVPLPRHGSLPRDAARLHQQASLPRPGLVRRLSSEEHIYEKTPYDAYSLASGSQAGSIGRHQGGGMVNPNPTHGMPIPSPSGTASTNMTFEMVPEHGEPGKKF